MSDRRIRAIEIDELVVSQSSSGRALTDAAMSSALAQAGIHSPAVASATTAAVRAAVAREHLNRGRDRD